VDYLKYDFCNNRNTNSKTAYTIMREALKETGRPIVFSICEWGSTKPWEWAQGIGHLWRATGDIINMWDGREDWGGHGMVNIIDLVQDLYPYNGPGHWNDPDMLEVGNGGMTAIEDQSHFSMWCMLAAPLMAGNDLSNMSDDTKRILTNKDVIAIDQDPLGIQAHLSVAMGDRQIWVKQLLMYCRTVDALILPIILVNSSSMFLMQFRTKRDWSQSWEKLVSMRMRTFRNKVGRAWRSSGWSAKGSQSGCWPFRTGRVAPRR
jgi:hypothetical protein